MRDALRIFLALLVCASPLVGDLIHVPLFPIAMGALLAYDGLTSRAVVGSVIFLVIAEIVWGMPVGVLSLAYMATVLVLRSVEYAVSITPLARQRDWSVIPLAKAAVLGWVLSLVMVFFSVLVRSFGYHQGSVAILANAAYHPIGLIMAMGVSVALGLVVLHRIDVPFRRTIIFGV